MFANGIEVLRGSTSVTIGTLISKPIIAQPEATHKHQAAFGDFRTRNAICFVFPLAHKDSEELKDFVQTL